MRGAKNLAPASYWVPTSTSRPQVESEDTDERRRLCGRPPPPFRLVLRLRARNHARLVAPETTARVGFAAVVPHVVAFSVRVSPFPSLSYALSYNTSHIFFCNLGSLEMVGWILCSALPLVRSRASSAPVVSTPYVGRCAACGVSPPFVCYRTCALSESL